MAWEARDAAPGRLACSPAAMQSIDADADDEGKRVRVDGRVYMIRTKKKLPEEEECEMVVCGGQRQREKLKEGEGERRTKSCPLHIYMNRLARESVYMNGIGPSIQSIDAMSGPKYG